eukprot:gnl/MRDRNA2_/MRDRNA2_62232_c0_seq1.p1 gnl/MRDRNA2_/MRDRNA2_62232_c0~~gnl/MRDRNA2_/MRDRNA2_62232_c0_seq1.p1  ORF type:complete len:626 (-),score=135.12 gnl/MRDRNA2_/MRDRNA2_62232_c0_seq1:77-1849(-)
MATAVMEIPPSLQGNPKGIVYHLVQANGLTPQDVVWEVRDTPTGQFVGHVSIPQLGLHKILGKPQQNKKLADRAVAEAASQKMIQALSGGSMQGTKSSVPKNQKLHIQPSPSAPNTPSQVTPGGKWAVRGGKLVQIGHETEAINVHQRTRVESDSNGCSGVSSSEQPAKANWIAPKKQSSATPSIKSGSSIQGGLWAVRNGKLVQVDGAGHGGDKLSTVPNRGPSQVMSAMATATKRKLSVPVEPAAKKKKVSTAAAIDKDTTWTKRTEDEKDQARATYQQWRDFRASIGMDPSSTNVTSFDGWYASVCLACLTEVQLINFPSHAKGARHAKSYKEIGGLQLLDGVIRPDPHAQVAAHQSSVGDFASLCGFEGSRVLVIGEQDYSFSLKVAQQQHESGEASIVATSYLAAHDPSEVEFHAKDDGERTRYSRKSLPSMNGALQQNLDALQELGGVALHSVDATNLEETLLPQLSDHQFDVVVFPFPRASLQRGCDPRNSQLLRGYFRSVAETGLLADQGVVQLLMLQNQYAEWDTACMALEHGFELFSRVALPKGFYQSREMSGKPWTPEGGEMYIFSQQGAAESLSDVWH